MTHVLQGQPIGTGGQDHEEIELNQHERERVIELMLSQERVISLLYDKTFQMTQVQEPGIQANHYDIEILKKQ